jgi:class 3 adenylate cyclase
MGIHERPTRLPAMCFLDLRGYTRLTEEHGDEAAADLAASLASLVQRVSQHHGGMPVKYLGDGVMFFFKDRARRLSRRWRWWSRRRPRTCLPPAWAWTPGPWCSRTATTTGERSMWRRGSPDGRDRTRSW